eukprot:SAG31_NODE_4764_length_2972_cov_2.026801_4_plen_484_part_01
MKSILALVIAALIWHEADAFTCTDPGTAGYTMTNTNLDTDSWDVTGVCADNYAGTVVVTACTEDGDYSVTGCDAIPDCTAVGTPDPCVALDCTTDTDTPYTGCTAAACTADDTPYAGCTVPECTDVDTPYAGCTVPACTAVVTPYAGCTAQDCTAVDTPYAGCTVPDCTAVGTPYWGCTAQDCTAVDTPYAGCTALECTAVDTPYAGCTVPDCTDVDTPYAGCLWRHRQPAPPPYMAPNPCQAEMTACAVNGSGHCMGNLGMDLAECMTDALCAAYAVCDVASQPCAAETNACMNDEACLAVMACGRGWPAATDYGSCDEAGCCANALCTAMAVCAAAEYGDDYNGPTCTAPPPPPPAPPAPPSSSSCSIQSVFAGLSDIKSDPDCQSGCNSAAGDGSGGGATCRADWTPGPHDTCNAACGRVFEPFWVRHCPPRGLLRLDSLHLAPRARAHVAGLVRRHADERQHGRDARDGDVLRSLPRDAV